MSFFKYLRRHPFPVVAHFERAVAVSFAFPEAVLRSIVPRALEIDTHEGLGFANSQDRRILRTDRRILRTASKHSTIEFQENAA